MLASEFLKLLSTTTSEELIEVKGIGEILAHNLTSFGSSKRNQLLIKKFINLESDGKGLEIKLESVPNNNATQHLRGEVIVITGSFDTPRSQIKTLLEKNGAKVTSSVTSSTTVLLAGQKAGSKLIKAQEIGVRVVNSYEELLTTPKAT